MKIALIGYGKMGKEIEQIALNRNHVISKIINEENAADLNSLTNADCDVAIEFTQPHSAVQNILACFQKNIPVVCGTTGWYEHLEKIKSACTSGNNTFFYASNFSVGVNIFFELNRKLASMMAQLKEYEISATEVHHIHKKDKPSGTALTLVSDLLKINSKYTGWALNEHMTESKNTIGINCIRQDDVVGTHLITYSSNIDEIEIKHTAHNRKGFATGAVLAAEFVQNKTGVFEMSNLLQELLQS